VLQEIAAEFGPGVIDENGALDREALGDIIFRDAEARGKLGRIVHPPVIAEMVRRLALAKEDVKEHVKKDAKEGERESNTKLVVLDIPLLFEGVKTGTGAASVLQFDATVAVWTTEEQQVERQIQRNGYDREEALRRVRAQLPLDEKRELANYVIDNSGSLEETEQQVRELVAKVSAEAASTPR